MGFFSCQKWAGSVWIYFSVKEIILIECSDFLEAFKKALCFQFFSALKRFQFNFQSMFKYVFTFVKMTNLKLYSWMGSRSPLTGREVEVVKDLLCYFVNPFKRLIDFRGQPWIVLDEKYVVSYTLQIIYRVDFMEFKNFGWIFDCELQITRS